MCEKSKIMITKVEDVEGLQTGEGVMKPFLFTENVSLIHLQVPVGMEVAPHSHPKKGILYCLSGELEIVAEDGGFIIGKGTVIVVPPDVKIGISNNSNLPVECLLISSPPTFKSAEELKMRLKQHRSEEKV